MNLPGVVFPTEPRVWISQATHDGIRPAPPDDTAVFEVGVDRHAAVVRVLPTSIPPCIVRGTLYERVPGAAIPVFRTALSEGVCATASRESGSIRTSWALARTGNEAGLTLELAKRPDPHGEINGRECHPAGRYRIANTFLAHLEAAGHRVAEIDSHIEEQSWAGEMS
jgi:hypothetical protein